MVSATMWMKWFSRRWGRGASLFAAWAVLLVALAGCVSIPPEKLSLPIERAELSEHVHFLAHPALKGRKPRSLGSRRARKYLASRFKTYGLLPWGKAEGYEQDFGFGTNVIAVLPGADRELAGQVVLVCAHYDHLGVDEQGNICPGASDNASGVAALLEVAERLSLSERRPKRTVCFCAFDCEEKGLLGAFAFSFREDCDLSKIAAVVNVDMLGRDSFDVLQRVLLLSGAGKYPGLRRRILQAAQKVSINLMPVSAELVGPVGDHVPFEHLQVPVLFFTCGYHRDYHRPSDSPAKMDYESATASAHVVYETVAALLDTQQIETPVAAASSDLEELRSVKTVLEQISERPAELGLKEEEEQTLVQLIRRAGKLLDGSEYTSDEREVFTRDVARSVWPVISKKFLPDVTKIAQNRDISDAEIALKVDLTIDVYLHYKVPVMNMYAQLVRHILENKPGLFGSIPEFKKHCYLLANDRWTFAGNESGVCRLSLLLSEISVRMEPMRHLRLSPTTVHADHIVTHLECVGSRGEIVDFCLLHWGVKRKDVSYSEIWRKVLQGVTNHDAGKEFEDWLQWRLGGEGYVHEGGWKEWYLRLMQSANFELQFLAVQYGSVREKKIKQMIHRIISDSDVHPDVRGAAVEKTPREASAGELGLLVGLLEEDTLQCHAEPLLRRRALDYDSPFYDCSLLKRFRETESFKRRIASSRTLADKARERLTALTGKDFGTDVAAWQKWIETHVK